MWSRRFEQPLILRPPERRTLFCMALACWLPGIALLILARIPGPVAALLGLGLLVCIAAEFHGWSRHPAAATWQPRRGWTLEWPGGSDAPWPGNSRAIIVTLSARPSNCFRQLSRSPAVP